MSKATIRDMIFGEPKGKTEFTYQTNGGQEFKVVMTHPNVKDKGWLASSEKYKNDAAALFIDVLLRADIRTADTNEPLFDPSCKDLIAGSDQDLLIKMAGDWISLVNRVKPEEAAKN